MNSFHNQKIIKMIKILIISRSFRIMDDDGSRSIDSREFIKGMHDYGLMLEKEECMDLFNRFDQDGSGTVDFDEFLKNLRVIVFMCDV